VGRDTAFGRRLAELRTERGLSLRKLGDHAHYSSTFLWELENGRKTPAPETAAALDRVLRAGGELVSAASMGDVADPPLPAPISRWRTAQSAEAGWGDMLRHTALLAPPPALSPNLGYHGRPGTSTRPPLMGWRRWPRTTAVRTTRCQPRGCCLPRWHTWTWCCRCARWQPDEQRTALLTTAGEMAALGGVLLGLDASQYQSALSYLDLAWSAARDCLDVELQTVVLGCRSFALAYGGSDHQAGLECADFARDLAATGASAETRAWVAAVASERCASLDDLAGCQERLDESRDALTDVQDDAATWRGIGGYGPEKLRAYEGGDLVRLGRYRDAELILDEALAALDPAQQRHRATALIDRADARLGGGDVDAACVDAADALGLVTIVQHAGNLDRIEQLAAKATSTGARAARTLRRDVQLVRADHGLPTRWENR
jgi:transcriptional regulator with XRE-family HTH domain